MNRRRPNAGDIGSLKSAHHRSAMTWSDKPDQRKTIGLRVRWEKTGTRSLRQLKKQTNFHRSGWTRGFCRFVPSRNPMSRKRRFSPTPRPGSMLSNKWRLWPFTGYCAESVSSKTRPFTRNDQPRIASEGDGRSWSGSMSAARLSRH
jgi:hypothetical protein